MHKRALIPFHDPETTSVLVVAGESSHVAGSRPKRETKQFCDMLCRCKVTHTYVRMYPDHEKWCCVMESSILMPFKWPVELPSWGLRSYAFEYPRWPLSNADWNLVPMQQGSRVSDCITNRVACIGISEAPWCPHQVATWPWAWRPLCILQSFPQKTAVLRRQGVRAGQGSTVHRACEPTTIEQDCSIVDGKVLYISCTGPAINKHGAVWRCKWSCVEQHHIAKSQEQNHHILHVF